MTADPLSVVCRHVYRDAFGRCDAGVGEPCRSAAPGLVQRGPHESRVARAEAVARLRAALVELRCGGDVPGR